MKKRLFLGILALIIAFSFIGCGDDDDDDKKENIPHEGITLIIDGIKAGILGGAILGTNDDGNPSEEKVVAVAVNSNGTFDFFEGSYDSNANIPIPTTNPWNGIGSYYIVLSTAMDASGDQYFYTDGVEFFTFDKEGYLAANTDGDDGGDDDDSNSDEVDPMEYIDINYKGYNFTEDKKIIKFPWSKFVKGLSVDEILEAIEEQMEP